MEITSEIMLPSLATISDLNVLKPDKAGYYNGVIVGALNVYNSRGELYVMDNNVKRVINETSIMARRCRDRSLYIEVTHPDKFNDMKKRLSPDELRMRSLDIDMRYVCAHIRSYKIDDRPTKIKGQPQPVYLIRASLKPIGNYKQLLQDSLESPEINTAFSGRNFVIPRNVGGVVWKYMAEQTTFDFVLQPGMQGIADKNSWAAIDGSPVASNESISMNEIESSLESNDLEHINKLHMSLESDLEYVNDKYFCEGGVCALLNSPSKL